MIIIDKRIDINCCVELETGTYSNEIGQEIMEHWLSPFFSVQEDNIDGLKVGARIKIVEGIQQDYKYYNNIFYVNFDMPINKLLYTLMSILRIFYKCLAYLLGYWNLHAACLKYKERGILINAERNQGKTTMLLNAIQDKEVLLLANDQVMYSINDDQLLGYPAAVGIRNNSCTSEKQGKINENALWFIDDQFQDQTKPVVHIKDLSKIYHCSIAGNAKLSILVNYEKSADKEELAVTDMGIKTISISELELPFQKIYKEELLKSCWKSIDYYIDKKPGQRIEVGDGNIVINQINIKCGLDRMTDMLCKIKSILR